MPVYRYKCRVCGHRFEAHASMSGRNDVSCEVCLGECGIVPSATQVMMPLWMSDKAPARGELTEPSGLVAQGERDGW